MLGKAVVDEVPGFLGDLAAGFTRHFHRIRHGIERHDDAAVHMFFGIGAL